MRREFDRRFEDILRNTDLAVERDEKASIGLDYRIIVLRKSPTAGGSRINSLPE